MTKKSTPRNSTVRQQISYFPKSETVSQFTTHCISKHSPTHPRTSATSAVKSLSPRKPYRKFFTKVKLGIKMKNPASSLQDRQDRKRSPSAPLRRLRPFRPLHENHTKSNQIKVGGTRLFSSFCLLHSPFLQYVPAYYSPFGGYPAPTSAPANDFGPWALDFGRCFDCPRNYHEINSDRARSCRIVGWQGTTTRTGNSALRA